VVATTLLFAGAMTDTAANAGTVATRPKIVAHTFMGTDLAGYRWGTKRINSGFLAGFFRF
jgi:hypothetical protein